MVALKEAKTKKKTLADLKIGDLPAARQAALMRLQLWFVGETHEILSSFVSDAAKVLQKAQTTGPLGPAEAFAAFKKIEMLWEKAFTLRWVTEFAQARYEAALIAFGTMAIAHDIYFKPAAARALAEQIGVSGGPTFDPQVQAVLDAASQRIYKDGLQLSPRIWKLDAVSKRGIQDTIMAGVSEGKSAWQVAKDLEQYLGANQDCPRWTSTRLFKLTKADIASGDRRGLITGAACAGQGASYNALRLARNEIQAAHALATDEMMQAQPWVTSETVMLSPAHPVEDICDEWAKAGPQPKGTYQLPAHPQCLCYKVAGLMDEDEFTSQLKGWLQPGPSPLDDYANIIGVPKTDLASTSLLNSVAGTALQTWLWGSVADIAGRIKG
jgi:hypothetical protein